MLFPRLLSETYFESCIINSSAKTFITNVAVHAECLKSLNLTIDKYAKGTPKSFNLQS